MGLSRNKVAVSEGAAGSPPFYGECDSYPQGNSRTEIVFRIVVQFSVTEWKKKLVPLTHRVHPFPFRTRKLSCAVPKILSWRRLGKIGRCQHPLRGSKKVKVKSEEVRKISLREIHRTYSLLSIHYYFKLHGGVAQLGEHLPCKQGVMGSNPIISTMGKDE